MIPVKLRIDGFLSYRQPVELDFTGFDLACISGHNGAGKSALLDAITWALFGQARKRDESVINNHPSVKAAEVTLDFDYEGNRYRVQRSNPRGKTSSVEFFILSKLEDEKERWKPLTEHTLRLTDQKIQDTLRMDFETFTNASFFLQGKADQFATARPGERKRILSNVLGLEIWESYRNAASLRRREKEKEVKELDGRLKEVQVELDEEHTRRAHLAELQSKLADLTAQRSDRAKSLETIRRLHASLEEQRKAANTLLSQVHTAQSNFDRIQNTLEERNQEKSNYDAVLSNAERIESDYAEWQRLRTALGAMGDLAVVYRQVAAKQQEPSGTIRAEEARLLQEKQELDKEKTALQKEGAEKENLNNQKRAAEEVIQLAQLRLERRQTLGEEVRELQIKQADAKAENTRLRGEMAEMETHINQLQVAEGADCPLCRQPLSDNERSALIRSLNEEGTALGDRFRTNKQLLEQVGGEIQKIDVEIANLKDADTALRNATRLADQIDSRLGELEKKEESWHRVGELRLIEIERLLAKEAFALEARQQLEAINAEMEALGYDEKAHETLRQAEQAGRPAEEAFSKLSQARAALAPLTRGIADLEAQKAERQKELAALLTAHTDAAVRLGAAEADLPELSKAESELFEIQERENILRKQVGGAEQKVAILESIKERKAAYYEEREQVTQQIADLKQLERAFGKDGVPALLIEQALPEIEASTNDLLSRLTNGRMFLRFATQREYKDTSREDQKETLDLVISDNLGERDYEMFSGGEAFRINFAIRLALSQVLARRAGARLQTLVIDEGFGSQDAQGRQRLVEAITLVRADFEKILVVTHLEELKEAFPTRIEVEKTLDGSQIKMV